MQRYQSHKIVQAARITAFEVQEDDRAVVELEDAPRYQLTVGQTDRLVNMSNEAGTTLNGGWLILYPDGWVSWSPDKEFRDGYRILGAAALEAQQAKLPIAGYRKLTDDELRNINAVKAHGANLGDLCDFLDQLPGADRRWTAIGRTHLQQGIMALTRAIARPEGF